MNVFLQTNRLLLRRFTEGDLDHLVDLDADAEVMRYINGGKPTSREEIETEILPRFLWYYDNFAGYGFWAAIEKASGESWVGSTSGRRPARILTNLNWDTGCDGRPGARVSRPRDRAL